MIAGSFVWTAPLLPTRAFNHPPQSGELEQVPSGAYVFARIVAL